MQTYETITITKVINITITYKSFLLSLYFFCLFFVWKEHEIYHLKKWIVNCRYHVVQISGTCSSWIAELHTHLTTVPHFPCPSALSHPHFLSAFPTSTTWDSWYQWHCAATYPLWGAYCAERHVLLVSQCRHWRQGFRLLFFFNLNTVDR